ncbi:GNAT family N-acetyltransferase [Zooshikella ganghwensis]|uniref:GNAT family N-acetyltransferase n=1 Tax=Zooshikella ganghwensis TaxID=202772 RepID=UPI000416E155|nr:GNAT family N-acetyltransferase [Zooshikella ganghwensis]
MINTTTEALTSTSNSQVPPFSLTDSPTFVMPGHALHAEPWSADQPLPEAFLNLPSHIYQKDSNWIPEQQAYLQQLFSTQNPFFQAGQAWLGVLPNASRLAGFYHPQQVIDGKPTAYFGFWETTEQLNANQALFEQLETWAKAQGATQLLGPINFSTFGRYRLRLSHFDTTYFPSEPWNPSYYASLLTQLGFKPHTTYHSKFTHQLEFNTQRNEQLRNKLDQRLTPRFQLSPLNSECLHQLQDKLYPLVEHTFSHNLAYTSINPQLFKSHILQPLANRLCPYSSWLATDKKRGDVVGFVVCTPDYGPILSQGYQHQHPDRQPLTQHQLNYYQHTPLLKKPTCLIKTTGVLPSHQHRGIAAWLCLTAAHAIRQRYQGMGAALIRDDNDSAKLASLLCDGPDCETHQYGLFCKPLNPYQISPA